MVGRSLAFFSSYLRHARMYQQCCKEVIRLATKLGRHNICCSRLESSLWSLQLNVFQ